MSHLEGNLSWQVRKLRTGCSPTSIAPEAQRIARRSDLAKAQPRSGGQFASSIPAGQRKRKHREGEEILQEKLDQQSARHKEEVALLTAASANLQNIKDQLAAKETIIRSLRAKSIASAITKISSESEPPKKKLAGGNSKITRKRLADTLQAFLDRRYKKAAQPQTLLTHFEQNPDLYKEVVQAIKEDSVSLASFLKACETHPDWLNPIRREVVAEIENFWTAEKCLSIQIHCKVGHSEKYQDLINLSSKTYTTDKKEWKRKELFYPGSQVYVPRFPSKNEVFGLRSEIAEEIPLIQDEQGTACWTDLETLIVETIRQERQAGYLQSREQVEELPVWLHWGGDAAGFLRGIKHTKFGFKLVGGGRVCTQSPRNLRTILLFEGKDNYDNYSEYMQPFFPVMRRLQAEGLIIDGIRYRFRQTAGADYVLLAEILGHAGHSCIQGCVFCLIYKKDYGRLIDNGGKLEPVRAEPRTREMAALAAHRPLKTGPDVKCPFCGEAFPNQAALLASKPPENPQAYQQVHAGQKFGCPPLFDFEVKDLLLCILHTLLRLSAVVFKRTIAANCDTQAKVDALNTFIKQAHLGCKKMKLKKKDARKTKDTEDINFIGR